MARLTAAQQALLADIVGGVEIAERLGVTRAVISMWQKRYPDFPAPVIELSAGRFYRWTEVQAWHDRRNSK